LSGHANQKFSAEFDQLTQRLLDGVIGRVAGGTRPAAARTHLRVSHSKFGGMRDALDELLRLTFEGSSFEEAPLLRGLYFN